MLHLRIFSKTLGKSLSSETVFLHGIVHSDVVSLSHIHHERPERKVYCDWISLFSVFFLVKNTYGVKEGRLCGGKGLFAFAPALAYRKKNPPGLNEEKMFWHSLVVWLFWNKQVLVIERVAQKMI